MKDKLVIWTHYKVINNKCQAVTTWEPLSTAQARINSIILRLACHGQVLALRMEEAPTLPQQTLWHMEEKTCTKQKESGFLISENG